MRSRTSNTGRALLALLAALAVVGLSGCADKGGEAEAESPAKVVAVKGQDVSRVTITEEAAERIGIKLDEVVAGPAGPQIPYGAVLYDAKGASWAFVNTAALTYVRQSITLDHIQGGVAYLTAGPAAGTKVVSVGATELYGAEAGVGDDE
jgi:hypothetical protein